MDINDAKMARIGTFLCLHLTGGQKVKGYAHKPLDYTGVIVRYLELAPDGKTRPKGPDRDIYRIDWSEVESAEAHSECMMREYIERMTALIGRRVKLAVRSLPGDMLGTLEHVDKVGIAVAVEEDGQDKPRTSLHKWRDVVILMAADRPVEDVQSDLI